ncbi:MAG: assimilatory sulfite reductase (NADPH) hemoprotein subunit, partial [Planctomycetota bacterium]
MIVQTELSKVEKTEAASDNLRGNVASELAAATEWFTRDTAHLLKRDGLYQQDDRDRRKAGQSGATAPPKVYSMMLRTKLPGGKLTARQLLTHLHLCDELGNATLRITARQDLQLHGVPKRDVRQAIRRINQAQLTTLGTCGDVGRNVMCCPAPYRQDPVRAQIQELADRLSAHLLPRASAYHETWLADPHSGEKQGDGNGRHQRDVEPLYGSNYLPRKFKIGVALPGDNCIDIYAQDLGLLAICEHFDVIGYNLVVGGGM